MKISQNMSIRNRCGFFFYVEGRTVAVRGKSRISETWCKSELWETRKLVRQDSESDI